MIEAPTIQLLIVSLVCCFIVGTYNIYYSLGDLESNNSTLSNWNNIALYASFSLCSIVSGSAHNYLGPRISVIFGCIPYMIYVCCLWLYREFKVDFLPVVGSVILGAGASLLWTAAGTIIMSYPMENQKGRFFGIFWILFNLGSLISGFLPFFSTQSNYITIWFLCLMAFGLCLSYFMVSPARVIREDGSRVTSKTGFNMSQELNQIRRTLLNKNILLLFPIFFYTNFYYSYRLGHFSHELFTVRTVALNTVCYWASQMLGAFTFGQYLDNPLCVRSKKARLGLLFVAFFTTATWLGCLFLELNNPDVISLVSSRIDILDDSYGASLVLMLLSGFTDATVQSWCYWMMGAMTNNAMILSRYAGFYKAIQSGGTAVAWYISLSRISPITWIIVICALFYVALGFAYVATKNISDTNYHITSHDIDDYPDSTTYDP
ncbi:hypothetical protein K7432_008305 [Basidiobolus ranarum]|uniref:MFS general substrate transporter n=1 Tax=Basidiobolus ranarum TaxID=34480 RepID=A0ABR2WS26_9FUNG